MIANLSRLTYSCMHIRACRDAAVAAKPVWPPGASAFDPCLRSGRELVPMAGNEIVQYLMDIRGGECPHRIGWTAGSGTRDTAYCTYL